MLQTETISFDFVAVDSRGTVLCSKNGRAEQVVFDLGTGRQLPMLSLPGGDFLIGSPDGDSYDQGPKGPYRHVLLDVDTFPSNPFGIHEMHGNLWEWCADLWHDSYDGAPGDSRAWEEGGNECCRVVRGGSWHETPDLCRSAVRLKLPYDEGDEMVGLRVAD